MSDPKQNLLTLAYRDLADATRMLEVKTLTAADAAIAAAKAGSAENKLLALTSLLRGLPQPKVGD